MEPASWVRSPLPVRHAPGTTIALIALTMGFAPASASGQGGQAPGTKTTTAVAASGSQSDRATRVTGDAFVPPLAMAAPSAPGNGAALPDRLLSLQRGELLTPETARIIATMTPEQIDALTLLLISLGTSAAPGAASVARTDVTPAASDAPWIGNWNDSDLTDDAALTGDDLALAQTNSVLPHPWQFVEADDGLLIVEMPWDRFSQIIVQPGMIIGTLGEVATIERSDTAVVLHLTDGREIAAARNPTVLEAELAARVAAAPAPVIPEDTPADPAPEPAPEPSIAQATAASVTDGAGAGESDGAVVLASAPTQPGLADDAAEGMVWVQVASFRSARTVAELEAVLRGAGFEAQSMAASAAAEPWHVVRVRTAETALDDTLGALRALGFADAYVIAADPAQMAQPVAAPPPLPPLSAQATPASIPADAGDSAAWIQVASFQIAANAGQTEALLRDSGFQVRTIPPSDTGQSLHSVRARPADARLADALSAVRALGFADAYIVRTSPERGQGE